MTRKQHAHAPEIGTVASPCRAVSGCLVEAAHALLHLRARHQRRALEREAEHLQVGHVEPPPELGRAAPKLRSLRGLATSVRHEALEEGKPTVLGPRLERVEQAMGSTEPAARDRERAVEVELIAGQPGGHPGGARDVSRLLVEVVRTLAGGEHGLGVVEPPRGPAQPLESLGRLLGAHRLLEPRPRLLPASFLQLAPAAVEPGRRGLVGLLGHASDSHMHRRASVG